MADKFVVVDWSRDIYYFNTEHFYRFVNQEDKDEEDRVTYKFLTTFPIPKDKEDTLEDEDEGPIVLDENGQPMGLYCPFSCEWPEYSLFVLKNNSVFIPSKKKVEKTITVEEYCEPVKRNRSRPATKKAAAKARAR